MATADGMFLMAGGTAFAGSMAEAKMFPPNGYSIIGGTIGLVLISATTRGTALEAPMRALAALMLLVSIYLYVPAFTKDRSNG